MGRSIRAASPYSEVLMKFVIATAPATEPVTSAELVSQCRIDSAVATAEATYITSLVTAARVRAENLCGPIITQAWDGYLDEWPAGDTITIEKPRVSAITTVKYMILDAVALSTFASASYQTDYVSRYARFRLKDTYSWPTDELEILNPIVIRFSAGWANAAAVPAALKQAILFLAAHWYENREATSDTPLVNVPNTFIDLLADYREWGF
jgi:uncharacterized phiE125 gp8 family phage protein